mgnify:CR=1 FL=1
MQNTEYAFPAGVVGWERCIRDSLNTRLAAISREQAEVEERWLEAETRMEEARDSED